MFLGKAIDSHSASLLPGVKWLSANLMLGEGDPTKGWHSIQGESLHASGTWLVRRLYLPTYLLTGNCYEHVSSCYQTINNYCMRFLSYPE